MQLAQVVHGVVAVLFVAAMLGRTTPPGQRALPPGQAGGQPTDVRKRRVKVDAAAITGSGLPEGGASIGLNLFPADVAAKEMAYYKRIQNKYGLPLDNRETYTKLDWTLWVATLTQNRTDFEAIVDPVYKFINATPDRSPLTDFYQTKTARKVGFTGRPVIGGVFMQMLYEKKTWKKYAG